MSKYEVPDDHWDRVAEAEEESDEQDSRLPVEMTRHTVCIDDNRDVTGYEYGVEWMFSIEDGVVVGWYRGHYLEGRTQSDPMTSPAWEDIPAPVKGKLRRELNDDGGDLDVDVPDFYGQGGDES